MMNKIGEVFAEYFKNWGITLPSGALKNFKSGEIMEEGWYIRYLFGADERGKYMDFYASHRITNDRHLRIYESGETQGLPVMWDMIIYPADATEEEQEQITRDYHEHNARVLEELERKGFS